jgi:hypothetical protein
VHLEEAIQIQARILAKAPVRTKAINPKVKTTPVTEVLAIDKQGSTLRSSKMATNKNQNQSSGSNQSDNSSRGLGSADQETRQSVASHGGQASQGGQNSQGASSSSNNTGSSYGKPSSSRDTSNRGLASADEETRQEVASEGGRSSQGNGRQTGSSNNRNNQ